MFTELEQILHDSNISQVKTVFFWPFSACLETYTKYYHYAFVHITVVKISMCRGS